MKVVFATGIFPPDIGGPATYVDGLARDLTRRGRECEVVSYGTGDASETPFPVHRVSRERPLPLRYASFFRSVRRCLRGETVCYIQDPVSSGLPAILAARSRRRPAILKVVGDLAWEIGRELGHVDDEIEAFQTKRYSGMVERLRRVERFVATRARRVVTPSRFLQRIVSGWGVDPANIDVVYNSVRRRDALASTQEEARSAIGIDGDPLLITAGRMAPWKGFDTLIDAMPAVLARHPRARLLIVGSGPLAGALHRRVEAAALGSAISFPGSLDADPMALHLRASDAFVLASTYEGFSHVLLEAMLARLPVVASNVGGNPELIDDGDSGLLASPDAAAMAEALVRLAGSAELRAKLGARAHERAASFRWDDMVSKTVAILEEEGARGRG